MHKFDPKNLPRLDDPERKKLLPPGEVLRQLGLKPGDRFLDIGAGTGYFSFPASELAGEKGEIISADVSEIMVSELSRRAAESGKKNIRVIQVREYETGAADGSIDMAFFCNVLHEVEDKPKMLEAVKRSLKKNGKLGIVEWKKVSTPMGPPLSERMDESELVSLLGTAGFSDIKTSDIHGTYILCSARITQ